MNYDYFRKINNAYNSSSKQETDLYLLNNQINKHFADSIDYQKVLRNGKSFELLVMKDTDANTYKKKIKSRPNQPFNLGDYIEWNGQHWLITLLDSDDKTCNSGYMYLCTILLRWQNKNGDIIERWCYSEDFTKYSSGVSGNNIMMIPEHQYGVTLPVDEETKYIKRDMRFVIDFDDIEEPDVYKLTNRKVLLNDANYFSRGGLLSWTLSYDLFNKTTDLKIDFNGKKVWICNYLKDDDLDIEDGNNAEDIISDILTYENIKDIYAKNKSDITLNCQISSIGKKEIVIGGNYKTFYCDFYDDSNNVISFSDYTFEYLLPKEIDELLVTAKLIDNEYKIKIKYDESLINSNVVIVIKDLNNKIINYEHVAVRM